MNRQLVDLIGAVASTLFDPNPITLRPADEKGVAPVRGACARDEAAPVELRRRLNRNAFLCGCLDYTEHAPIEHLIVGLGERYGSTTKVGAVAHVTGREHDVSVPPWLQREMERWIAANHASEVLVFHNHPASSINLVLDNRPIPSATDRATLLASYLRPLVGVKALLGGGRVRFYVGENGFVSEFTTPNLLRLLQGDSRAS